MATTGFDGSTLLRHEDLVHGGDHRVAGESSHTSTQTEYRTASIRRAFATTDDEGALLLLEVDVDDALDEQRRHDLLDLVAEIANNSIRKHDLVAPIDDKTLAIGLPGSGRIGMTRVADAIRQRVAAERLHTNDGVVRTTITVGAVHTTEANLVDLDELLLVAGVNLDSARAAGRNRTNWSDWSPTR